MCGLPLKEFDEAASVQALYQREEGGNIIYYIGRLILQLLLIFFFHLLFFFLSLLFTVLALNFIIPYKSPPLSMNVKKSNYYKLNTEV